MEWHFIRKITALAIAFPTTAFLLYWLFLRREDEDDREDQTSGESSTKSRHTVIQVTVPSKAVGAVIGSKGANIKKIQEETGARMNFSEQDREREEDRTLFIRGDCESAQKAEVLVRQVIADMPVLVTEEVLVPTYCLGRLIGKGGETIRSMSRTSRCRINIDKSQDAKPLAEPRVVTITGSQSDIQIAKDMIQEKVVEEEESRTKMATKAANGEERKGKKRSPEKGKEKPAPLASRVVEDPEGRWDAGDQAQGKLQIPRSEGVRESMEVFVSAVEHADHFWLQMVDHAALNLDKMTDDMSIFYSDVATSQKYTLTEVKTGDVVAAPFSEDNLWYRARVEGFEEGKVDLYYLDFGDNGLTPLEALRELKPEYLSLPVQAIECKLANVRPAGGEEWSEESSDAFEELTHCADWKILSARTVGYVSLDGSRRPCVQLVDNATSPPTDVAEELVARGLALWDHPPPTSTTTTTSTPSASPVPSLQNGDEVTPRLVENGDTLKPDPVPEPRS